MTSSSMRLGRMYWHPYTRSTLGGDIDPQEMIKHLYEKVCIKMTTADKEVCKCAGYLKK